VTCESELLQRARQLDSAALGTIYDQYSDALYRYALRLLGNADLAEECVAEVFSRFLHALHDGGGPRDHLQAYLYRTAHNWITDRWRRAPPPMVELSPTLTAGDDSNPVHLTGDPVEQQRIRAALVRLTAEQRQVIVLKYLEDWDNAQIAAALAKPVGAIKSLQHRALAALRRILESKS
jgi:RNA polymerase sigma-70 factor (ECF subfamily)